MAHLRHREHLAAAAKRIAGGAGARPDHQISGSCGTGGQRSKALQAYPDLTGARRFLPGPIGMRGPRRRAVHTL
jgi:hypothetical protein